MALLTRRTSPLLGGQDLAPGTKRVLGDREVYRCGGCGGYYGSLWCTVWLPPDYAGPGVHTCGSQCTELVKRGAGLYVSRGGSAEG